MTTSLPVANYLRALDLADMFVANGLCAAPGSGPSPLPIATPLEPGEKYPTLPDRQHLITSIPGGGLQAERALDVVKFQVMSRGKPAIGGKRWEATEDAETIAWALDAFMLSLPAGMIGAQYVNNVDRSGSAPQFLSRDAKGRVLMLAAYQFVIARTGR